MNGKSDRDTKSANRSEGIKRRTLLLSTTSLVALSGVTATALPAQGQPPQEILPKPEPPFRGKMGRTLKDSTPDFPKGVEAPAGAPNVLLILTAGRSRHPPFSGSPIVGSATTCTTPPRSARRPARR